METKKEIKNKLIYKIKELLKELTLLKTNGKTIIENHNFLINHLN